MLGPVIEQARQWLPAKAARTLVLALCGAFAGYMVYRHGELWQLPSRQSVESEAFLGLLALILLVLCAIWQRRIHRSLADLSAALEKLSVGNTDIHLPDLSRNGEIGRLSRSLRRHRDAMAHSQQREAEIREHCTRLEHLIAERARGADADNERAESARASECGFQAHKPYEILAPIDALEAVPFDLDGVLAGIRTLMSTKAAEKGLELIIDTGSGIFPVLIGDPLRLGQVLTDLVGNAIKFSRQGDIVLAVREKRRSGDDIELHFSVRDQGIGLTPEQQAGLILAPSQAERPAARHFGGTGLGLAICKRQVEIMGGSLWVESRYGAGSAFHVMVCLKNGGQPSDRSVTYAERLKAFAGRRVMVIDDNATSLRVAGALLNRLGFVPDLFDSGRAALACLMGSQAPDYLFCCTDLKMPDLDGFQVVRLLRAHYGRACPPLLLLGTFGAAGDQRELTEKFAAVVSKPLSLEHLFHHVASVLRLSAFSPKAEQYGIDWRLASLLKGKRVLLAGDADFHQDVLADFLQEAEIRVRRAADGLDALQAVREQLPDCVLMDCRMPVMGGFEATARLRARGLLGLPVIGLTTDALATARGICQTAGMNDVIGKPVNFSALLVTLVKWLVPSESGKSDTAPVPTEADAPLRSDNDGTLPPLPPGLDVESGLKRLRGKTALFLKALRMFRDSRGHQFQLEFRAAVAAEDWQTSERLAHTLRATAASIGANEVSAAAALLEAAIQAGNYREVQPLLTDVTDKLRAIVDGLAHIG